MKPTKQELDDLIQQGKLSEILWSYLNNGEYLIDKPLPKGWSPNELTPDPSNEKSIWVVEEWFYINLDKLSVESCKLKANHNMVANYMKSGNYFQTKLQGEHALESVIKLLSSLH